MNCAGAAAEMQGETALVHDVFSLLFLGDGSAKHYFLVCERSITFYALYPSFIAPFFLQIFLLKIVSSDHKSFLIALKTPLK